MRAFLSSLIVAASIAGIAVADEAKPTSPLGKKIDAFTARDFRGKEVSLAEFADKRLVVVAFLGVECPLAKLYAPRLAELSGEYASRGVAFVGVDANRQDN